ncbi:rhodanese-like domain-containing protein [Streptococcus equi]|uniref:rhodanese-like domain-containing protein n=1 Tax=Streptococcus equi TaxID=1336 RepID=UPI0002D80ECB|nr:rhodanese-like domain-containing protein [Streptococcus equi]KIS13919.1 membrane protein [Streptococcus equi subsp. zooepidemicus Sz105]HEL1015505.1 rhodanese-like domain-containing protein [Streptococcus equi subsp. ruminatorum]AIA67923.1 NADH dehydrogenase [Streptococcus equi subsp. zooepidemicus CY]KIS12325.1 membrane protein [Streptococcus equi subsp. zooepidemicus Sz57]MBR7683610.1 rhodanese-like domain-containing protein [Streptococcus equi subsp. zooepidemicus]
MSPLTIIGWVLFAGVIAYYLWNYVSYRRMAKQVDNDTFKELMRQGQVIDLRDPASFRARHILGARNFPTQQFATSIKALRKDKPILLYENVRPQYRVKAVKTLRKAGYTDLYVLKAGLDYWNGKVK